MLDRIIALIEREIALIEHNLVRGTCPDYTTYREQVAMIATFMIAMDLVKKAFAEDDED
jgi:hypothetical protein